MEVGNWEHLNNNDQGTRGGDKGRLKINKIVENLGPP